MTRDQYKRVKMMAEDDGRTWDFSRPDREALAAIIAEDARLHDALDRASDLTERVGRELSDLRAGVAGLLSLFGFDDEDMDDAETIVALRESIEPLLRDSVEADPR